MDLKKIESFIENKIEENLNLDYKASGSLERDNKKTNEISKDVSAFANSDGGIIIYGIKEDPKNRHIPESIDPINRNKISKEWLEQIIQSKVRPRISGIIIHSISVEENSDDVVYVVEIPKSNTAHQANDKKYYKRFNFNSEPMYDYEIKDILNRTKSPVIDLELVIQKHTHKSSQQGFDMDLLSTGPLAAFQKVEQKIQVETNYELKVYARNNGRVLSNYVNVYFEIPVKYLKEKEETEDVNSSIFMENTIRDIVDSSYNPSMNGGYLTPKYGPSRYDPILPTRCLLLKKVQLTHLFIESTDILKWRIYSDNAEPRTGSIELSKIEILEK